MQYRMPLIFILVLLLAVATVVLFFRASYLAQVQHVAQQNLVALDVAYRSSISMYRLDVENRFKNQILREDVLDLLEQANQAGADNLPLLRGRLYRALHQEYGDMVQTGLRQLHFHFPDGRSLLRFHSPTHLGDASLFEIRPSIRIVNTELRPAVGFEGGRVLPGFRNVYPIIRAGRHLGSVELSLPFERIHQNLIDLLPRGDYALLLHRRTVDMVFDDQRDKFVAAEVHHDYMKENPEISLVSRAFVFSENGRLLNALLRSDAEAQARLAAGDSFSIPLMNRGNGYIASFHAIDDLQGRHAAYLVGYIDAPVLLGIREAVIRQASVVFILLLLLAMSGWALIRHRQQLAEEKSRLQAITETMSDGLYVIDGSGKTVFVNRAAIDLTGFSREEMLGRVAHDMFHNHVGNEHQPAAECSIIHAAQTGSAARGEELFIDRYGRIFPVEYSCRPLVENSTTTGSVILFRDISAERETLERMRLQSAALNASANAVVITDAESVIKWANPAFTALTGFPVAEAIGKRPRELVRSGLQPILLYQEMWQTILAGKAWQGELINRRKNGELYDEAMTITPVRDGDGVIRHFIAIKQDISKRKQQEALTEQARMQIEQLSARNQLLLNSAGDGIYGTDQQGVCIFINPTALNCLGFEHDEVVGQDQHRLFHHHHRNGEPYDHADCPIHLTLADGQHRDVEDVFIRKNGELFDVHLSVRPIIEAGRCNGAVVVFQDITERKRMEAELQRLATTDTLTGIANRRHFMQQLSLELERVSRYGKAAALLMLDLDHFKSINDRYGHATGDRVLRHFAELTQRRLRRVDLFGRLGGEEFGVLLPDTSAAGAVEFAESLRRQIAHSACECDDLSEPISYTVSIGVANCAESCVDADGILAHADRALYQAKETGRNRISVISGIKSASD